MLQSEIQPATAEWIEKKVLKVNMQTLVFQALCPVNIRYTDTENSLHFEEKALFLSNCRFFVCRNTRSSQQKVEYSHSFLDLSKITFSTKLSGSEQLFKLEIHFKGQDSSFLTLKLNDQQVSKFLQSIREISWLLDAGFSKHPSLKNTPKQFQSSKRPKEMRSDPQIMLGYFLAFCDQMNLIAHPSMMKYLDSHQMGKLELAECFGYHDPLLKRKAAAQAGHVKAFFKALACVNPFQEIWMIDASPYDDVMKEVRIVGGIHTAHFINVNMSRGNFENIFSEAAKSSTLNLKHFSVSNCEFGDKALKCFLDALDRHGSVLRSLRLEQCGISASSCERLWRTLSKRSWTCENGLQILSISGNSLGNSGSVELCKIIRSSKALTELDISRTKVPMNELLHSISTNLALKLEKLVLSGNKWSKQTIKQLADIMKNTNSLTTVQLSNCKLSEAKICILFGGMLRNKHKLGFNLDLSHNDLETSFRTGLEKARDLHPELDENLIHSLNISGNHFDLKEMEMICEILQLFKGLQKLDISANARPKLFHKKESVGDAIAKLLMNSNLQELDISGDPSHFFCLSEGVVPVFKSLANNKHLKRLFCRSNRVSYSMFRELSKSMDTNKTLQELYISGNNCNFESILLLCELAHSSQLSYLDIQQEMEQAAKTNDHRKHFQEMSQKLEKSFARRRESETRRLHFEQEKDEIRQTRSKTLFMSTLRVPVVKEEYQYWDPKHMKISTRHINWSNDQMGVSLTKTSFVHVDGYQCAIPSILVYLEQQFLALGGSTDDFLTSSSNESEKYIQRLAKGPVPPRSSNAALLAMRHYLKSLPERLLITVQDDDFSKLREIVDGIPPVQQSLLFWLLDFCIHVISNFEQKEYVNFDAFFFPALVSLKPKELSALCPGAFTKLLVSREKSGFSIPRAHKKKNSLLVDINERGDVKNPYDFWVLESSYATTPVLSRRLEEVIQEIGPNNFVSTSYFQRLNMPETLNLLQTKKLLETILLTLQSVPAHSNLDTESDLVIALENFEETIPAILRELFEDRQTLRLSAFSRSCTAKGLSDGRVAELNLENASGDDNEQLRIQDPPLKKVVRKKINKKSKRHSKKEAGKQRSSCITT